jgi:hypothetical protein
MFSSAVGPHDLSPGENASLSHRLNGKQRNAKRKTIHRLRRFRRGSKQEQQAGAGRGQEFGAGAGIVFPAPACCSCPCFENLCNRRNLRMIKKARAKLESLARVKL